MNAAESLTGEDLAFYERALQLKDQGINEYKNKNKKKQNKKQRVSQKTHARGLGRDK